MNNSLTLVELNHGERKELFKGTLEEIVTWLKVNQDSYTWILDEDPNIKMPDLMNVETRRELERELNKVDLSWWSLLIEK